MYPAGGGAASNVVDRIVCSQPSDPDRAAARAARNPSSNRRWNPICTGTALPLATLITSSVPSTSGATGFSQKTGTPAWTPRLMSSGCAPVVAAMTRASIPAPSNSATDSAACAPVCPATSRARPRSASVTTSESTPGSPRSVLAWNTPIRPTPTSPMRMTYPRDARLIW